MFFPSDHPAHYAPAQGFTAPSFIRSYNHPFARVKHGCGFPYIPPDRDRDLRESFHLAALDLPGAVAIIPFPHPKGMNASDAIQPS